MKGKNTKGKKNKNSQALEDDDETTTKHQKKSHKQTNIKQGDTVKESNDQNLDEETKRNEKNFEIGNPDETKLKNKEEINQITKERDINELIKFIDKSKQYKPTSDFSKALETANLLYFLNDSPLKDFSKELENKNYLPKKLIDYLKIKESDISRTKSNNISKISNFCDLKDEYKGSLAHQEKISELAKTMPFYRKIRGDGNCFYRAVIIIYLDSLFFNDVCSYKNLKDKESDSKIFKFLKKIKAIEFLKFEDYDNREYFKKIFKDTEKLRDLILLNISQLFLRKLLLQKKQKNDNNNWFTKWQEYFLEAINTKPEFDIGLILLLRSMIFQKLENAKNENLKDFIIDREGLKKKLETYGLEAEDMIVPFASVAMNAKVFVNMIHKDYNKNVVTLKIEEYNLAKHSKREIHVLFKPGHYDAGYGVEFENAFEKK